MARPTLITVRGTYLRPDGTPESGTVTFRAPGFVRHALSDDVMAPGTLIGLLDGNGDLSVQVPATDDPNWSPIGWTYEVKAQLSGSRTVFPVAIPAASPGGVLDLSDLLPAPAEDGELYAPVAHTHDGKLDKAGGTMTGVLRAAAGIEFGPAGDANLYRVAAAVLQTDGKVAVGLDVECTSGTHGLVLHDRSNGNAFRLRVISGVLSVEPA